MENYRLARRHTLSGEPENLWRIELWDGGRWLPLHQFPYFESKDRAIDLLEILQAPPQSWRDLIWDRLRFKWTAPLPSKR